MITAVRVVCFTILLFAFPFCAEAEDFTDAIHAYLQQYVEAHKANVGIVVGIVDENGSSVVSYGKMDNGTDQDVNGDTLFDIASVTKTFTGLLLQDMIERGDMKLDDPVAKYLPASVKMPTRNGKEITLLHLATHTSGLPGVPDNLDPKRADNPYADYTVEKLYAFLSGYKMTRDPGAKFEYSGLGMRLLGQAIALKAGTNYESLVVDRICRPLKMDSTRITLTPELKARFAQGHNQLGYAVSSMDYGALMGGAALRSTVNDLLKYVSANLGLMPSRLTPLMEKTHVVHFSHMMPDNEDTGLAWGITPDLQGRKIVCHGGGAPGYRAWVGFDKTRRRGVVILSDFAMDKITRTGKVLLESEWQSDRRPTEMKINSRVYGSYVGQYRPSDAAPRRFKLWPFSRHEDSTTSQSNLGIRREGDRLFAQATGSKSWPVDVLLPPGDVELLSESENCFFERLSGMPMTFSRNARGKVTGLKMDYQGKVFYYKKISNEPPKVPESPKPRVAIKLDTKLLDACVGHYEFAPNAMFPTGMKLTIWREGDQLVSQCWGKNVGQGAFDIYPESETNFFLKTADEQFIFIKNKEGEVTAAIDHEAGLPDIKGKKLKNLSE